MTENNVNQNLDFLENDLLNFENNLTWTFTSVGAIEIANWLFSDYAHIVNEPWIGQHLGIITDRRGEEIVTNFEMHQNREDYLFCEKYKNSWSYFLRKLVLGRLFAQYGNPKKPIIVSDLPAANYGSNILSEATQNSKVIIFVRDGRDVVNQKAVSLPPIGKGLQMGLSTFSQNNKIEFLKMESRKWAKMMSILLEIKKNHNENLVKIVKLENLYTNTRKEIQEVFEFVGIKTDQSKLSEIASKIKKKFEISSQKLRFMIWNKDLSDDEKTVIEEIMSEQLRTLNYS